MGLPESRRQAPLELWGGVECTVNRVRDCFFDQFEWSGHARRCDDLDKFARLGIRKLRHSILWERVAPRGLATADWRWPDESLDRLESLGIEPIVGLLHHGSGPEGTHLLDPNFPEKLAAFAGAVAVRYPHVRWFTPVNEPLTTARFSALYGHWYPHATDDKSFVRALTLQCRGIVLAMEAIRRVRPDAGLVQTEDLGSATGSSLLKEQAAFENERRWLTWDLLCGRVGDSHPLAEFLRRSGFSDDDFAFFRDRACVPAVVGVNHYVTSDRYLDHRLERYPNCFRGGNGRVRYADVEAVRVRGLAVPSLATLLRQVHGRYGVPVAVTEVHLGCTREEQCRWFLDLWNEAQRARLAGVDVTAVTAWALLGSFDWCSLVTRPIGDYEVGAFDVRTGEPRPTALAQVLKDLGAGRESQHPALEHHGWWRRPERWIHEAETVDDDDAKSFDVPRPARKTLVLLGSESLLACTLQRAAHARGLAVVRLEPGAFVGSDSASLRDVLVRLHAWASAFIPTSSDAEGHDGNLAGTLASVCQRLGVAVLAYSSSQVFDGRRRAPYFESCPPSPATPMGRRHAEVERRMLGANPSALVIRTGPLFAPGEPSDFLRCAIDRLREGATMRLPTAGVVTPALVSDVVQASLDLLVDGAIGIWHLAGADAVSWEDVVSRIADRLGLRPEKAAPWYEPSQAAWDGALGSERHAPLRSWEEALRQALAASDAIPFKDTLYA